MHLSQETANAFFSSISIIEGVFFAFLVSFIMYNIQEMKRYNECIITKIGLNLLHFIVFAAFLYAQMILFLWSLLEVESSGFEFDYPTSIMYASIIISMVVLIIVMIRDYNKHGRWKNRYGSS